MPTNPSMRPARGSRRALLLALGFATGCTGEGGLGKHVATGAATSAVEARPLAEPVRSGGGKARGVKGDLLLTNGVLSLVVAGSSRSGMRPRRGRALDLWRSGGRDHAARSAWLHPPGFVRPGLEETLSGLTLAASRSSLFLYQKPQVSMLKVVSSAALVVVILAVVTLAATGSLFAASPIPIAVQVAALGLAVWARSSFPRDSFRVVATPGSETIIRKGPYRLIRHPMYSAALLLVWSGIGAHLAAWSIAIGAVATCVVVARVVVEERLLRERYAEYGEYARTTKALIPFLA